MMNQKEIRKIREEINIMKTKQKSVKHKFLKLL